MTKDEALKLALEAFGEIEWSNNSQWQSDRAKVAITAIKEALAQPEQEPVAFENWHKANYFQNLERYGDTYKNNHVRCRHQGWLGAQSFLPQRTWIGLTDIDYAGLPLEQVGLVRWAEAKLKEKNT